MNTALKFPFYAKASLIFVGLFSFISMLYIGQRIIVPVIYSTIIAIVLSPMVDFFVRKKINRIVSIAIAITILIAATALIVSLLWTQITSFSDAVPKLISKFHQLLDDSVAWASSNFNISTRKINAVIAEKNAEMMNATGAVIGRTIISTGSVLIILVLIPVYIFMILYYQPLLLEFIHKLFKSTDQREVNEVLSATKKIIRGYLIGLLMEAAIIAALNSISLLIIGIDYAIILGIIGAILNAIPFIGGIIAVALPMTIALVSNSSLSACLLVLVAYIIIQFIDNHYIMPKVVASKVKINALISIIVVLAGGALWGIPGMFISIPMVAIIKVIFDHIDTLEPWGFLLGDTMPDTPVFKLKLKK